MTKQQWFHGLAAAFIGGLSGAGEAGLTLLLIAPQTFNLGPDVRKTLFTISVFALLSGGKVTLAYLKQSPIWSTEVTAESHTVGREGDRIVQRDVVATVKTQPATPLQPGDQKSNGQTP